MQEKKWILPLIIVLAVITGIVAGSFVFKPKPKKSDIPGFFWPQAKALPGFAMQDHNGAAFGPENFKNHWSLVFFGYTHCPDVCPTSMGVFKQVKARLAEHGEVAANTRYVFISVDPERDTPATLKAYLGYFDPEFIGISGSEHEVAGLTRTLGVVYKRLPGESKDIYTVDHSASILLINPQGEFAGLFSTPHHPAEIVKNYLAMRQFVKENI